MGNDGKELLTLSVAIILRRAPHAWGIPFCITSQNRHGNTQQSFCAILGSLAAVLCTQRNWHDNRLARLAPSPK